MRCRAIFIVRLLVILGDTVKVILKSGQGHGWKNFQPDMKICADWFDQYLRGIKTDDAAH